MSDSEETIRARIDNDEGLRSKRRMLTIASLILLAIQFSGAKVEKANTFILELSFEHQHGLILLLLVSIVFLLIRYYNYAKPYHDELYKLWSSRMLELPFFIQVCRYSDDVTGLIYDVQPEGVGIGELHDDNVTYDWSYKCYFPFRRYINYVWQDEHDYGDKETKLFGNINHRKYLMVLWLELKYQFLSFFTHRENLDILAPYMLGVVAICSFFFRDEFLLLTNS